LRNEISEKDYMTNKKPKVDYIAKFLTYVERTGNALPHPATLFAILALLTILLSWVFSLFDLSVIHPGSKEVITPFNLLSVEGLHKIILNMVTNFTGFAPLGTVLVAMLGIGVAESSGLISSAIRLLVISAPQKMMTFILVIAGILSNTASEIGYVLLVPLGAIIFLGLNRHPIAGMAAAFAGVSGGYSANLLLGTIDPLLAGLSEEAANIIIPGYTVNAAANYYFMAGSVIFIGLAGTWVTEKIVIPRLGVYEGEYKIETTGDVSMRGMTKEEKRGLWAALIAAIIFSVVIAWGVIPEDGFLRNAKTGDVLNSPFMKGIVAFIFLGATFAGAAYGFASGKFKNDADVMKGMGKAIETLGVYIVLVFFAAQFVAYFNWTNLGLIFAIEGAEVLKSSGLSMEFLLIAFIILSAIINLVMGSASAKWAIMAPVFIPMFMLLGYSPELVQGAYRVGDSVTNIISPMMSYFAIIVAFMEKYDKKAGIGTVIATMLPYSIVFFFVWTILFLIWFELGIPLGPGSPLFIDVPGTLTN